MPFLKPGTSIVYTQCVELDCPGVREGCEHAHARVERDADEPGSRTRPQWHYGPTSADPDPGKVWCPACLDEVLWFDGIGVCRCGQWDDDEESGDG